VNGAKRMASSSLAALFSVEKAGRKRRRAQVEMSNASRTPLLTIGLASEAALQKAAPHGRGRQAPLFYSLDLGLAQCPDLRRQCDEMDSV
jgi:hypothetical protein